jgi:hypothetical protein
MMGYCVFVLITMALLVIYLIHSWLYTSCRWYVKDDNSVPSQFVLLPISSHLPDFISKDRKKQKAAGDLWWDKRNAMQDAMYTAAKAVLEDPEIIRKYTMAGRISFATLSMYQRRWY